jgi:dCMP deaminase
VLTDWEWIKHPNACEGAKYDSGEGLGKCQAIHAEQNALLQCPDIMKIHTCYTTSSPCNEQCIKLLLNTSCQRIVFLEEYSKSGREAWLNAGREWVHHNGTDIFNLTFTGMSGTTGTSRT